MYFKLHELTLFLEFKSKPCYIFFLRCLQQFNFDLFLSTSFQGKARLFIIGFHSTIKKCEYN